MIKTVRRFLPLTWTAFAALAWRNRDEIIDLVGYGARSARNLLDRSESNSDIAAEARLRVALLRDPRTRRGEGLHVVVVNGVARLNGRVDPDVRAHAIAIAEDTDGIHEIDESRLRVIGGRRNKRGQIPAPRQA